MARLFKVIKHPQLLFGAFLSIYLLAHVSPLTAQSQPQLTRQSSSHLTPQPTSSYDALEVAIIAEINQARTNPKSYADYLESLRGLYQGNLISLPGEQKIQTQEGVAALDEAIAFLRQQSPLPTLQRSTGMSLGAKDHVRDLATQGLTGSRGSDGSTVYDRLNRYGTLVGEAVEVISYRRKTAKAIVLFLLLNDGNSSRSVRNQIFRPELRLMGIACAAHPHEHSLCVTNYALEYNGKKDLSISDLSTSSPHSSQTPIANREQIPAQPLSNSLETGSNPLEPALNTEARRKKQFLSGVEQQIIAETNRVRQNPSAYAAELEKLRPYYTGKILRLPGMPPIETIEGVGALNDAISVLRRMRPRNGLKPSLGLSLGARDHAKDLGASGNIGHGGSDRSNPFDRISRYGTWSGMAGENISYGPIHFAQWHVMQLIIDDGVANRGHREALLQQDYQLTGVACAPHPVLDNVCVITYAMNYQEKD